MSRHRYPSKLRAEIRRVHRLSEEITANPFSHLHLVLRCPGDCKCDARLKDWTKPEPHTLKHNVRG